MPKRKPIEGRTVEIRPASTPEGREAQAITLAMSEAIRRIADGTASDALLTHFLKLATTKEQLEKEKLSHEVELVQAKTEALKEAKDMKEMYANAIRAMGVYSGKEPEEEVYE